MPVVGEPLSYRNAVLLWSVQTVRGTPVTPAVSAGLTDAVAVQASNNQFFWGPGSHNFLVGKGGMATTDLDLTFKALQAGGSIALLKQGMRTAGILPLSTIAVGYSDDTGTPLRNALQVQDAKVNSLTLNYDAGTAHNLLTASLNIIGGIIVVLTTLAPVTLAAKPFMTYECILTEEATGYEIRSLSLNVAHNLRRDPVIPGSTPATGKRFHKYLTEGVQNISGSISRFVPSGQDVHANTLSARDMVLTATNLDDATTLILTLTDCYYDNERRELAEGGIMFSHDFVAQNVALTGTA